MNEILFRGKTEGGKWVYGLPDYGNFQGTINIIKEFKQGTLQSYKVIPETIAPYVGVTDNTGQRIFRDSICFIERDNGKISTVCKYYPDTGYMLWAETSGPYSVAYTYCGGKAVKVVGTIHD